jgi:cell division control protein 12
MKRLSSRVNLIPVVAKADTLSHADLAKYKERVSRKRSGRLRRIRWA